VPLPCREPDTEMEPAAPPGLLLELALPPAGEALRPALAELLALPGQGLPLPPPPPPPPPPEALGDTLMLRLGVEEAAALPLLLPCAEELREEQGETDKPALRVLL
jgi:hypothetical protein